MCLRERAKVQAMPSGRGRQTQATTGLRLTCVLLANADCLSPAHISQGTDTLPSLPPLASLRPDLRINLP